MQIHCSVGRRIHETHNLLNGMHLAQKYQKELEEQRAALQRCVEANRKHIDELSSRVQSLEGQLIAKTDTATALDAQVR